jgi:hypothetical protein
VISITRRSIFCADLPVVQVRTGHQCRIGLTVPPTLLARADAVIE